MRDLAIYVGRIREFERRDWLVYVAWVGLIASLAVATFAFVLFGASHGAPLPTEAWLVPAGAAVFTVAIAVDTIGHRTIYKGDLAGAESLVHGVTIFCGIGSVVLLCAAWHAPGPTIVPAAVLTALSIVYSLVDEAMHWRRYLAKRSDAVEMWSHVFILLGHATMMLAWWRLCLDGYPGVAETVRALGARA